MSQAEPCQRPADRQFRVRRGHRALYPERALGYASTKAPFGIEVRFAIEHQAPVVLEVFRSLGHSGPLQIYRACNHDSAAFEEQTSSELAIDDRTSAKGDVISFSNDIAEAVLQGQMDSDIGMHETKATYERRDMLTSERAWRRDLQITSRDIALRHDTGFHGLDVSDDLRGMFQIDRPTVRKDLGASGTVQELYAQASFKPFDPIADNGCRQAQASACRRKTTLPHYFYEYDHVRDIVHGYCPEISEGDFDDMRFFKCMGLLILPLHI
ncbi:hypothetical protein EMIT0373P_10567 [Pseudomonas chlororaphis]